MTWVGWRIVELLSRMLKPDERDAVLGDHEELGMSPARSILDLAGLVARRSMRLAAKALRVVVTAQSERSEPSEPLANLVPTGLACASRRGKEMPRTLPPPLSRFRYTESCSCVDLGTVLFPKCSSI